MPLQRATRKRTIQAAQQARLFAEDALLAPPAFRDERQAGQDATCIACGRPYAATAAWRVLCPICVAAERIGLELEWCATERAHGRG